MTFISGIPRVTSITLLLHDIFIQNNPEIFILWYLILQCTRPFIERENPREALLTAGKMPVDFSNFLCKTVMSKGIVNLLSFIIYYYLLKYSYEKNILLIDFMYV